MKILIVCGFFPPHAPMAATRAGKFAKHLHGNGHEVRVLAALNNRYPPVLPLEIPRENVVYAPVPDINSLPDRIVMALSRPFRRRRPVPPQGDEGGGDRPPPPRPAPPGPARRMVARLRRLYATVTNIPDAHIGWQRHAVRAGRAILADWRPDIIYASVPPHSGLLVAHRLAREFDLPWVPEFRDLWVSHPYYEAPFWRRAIEARLERKVLANCVGIVTVTRTWADFVRARMGAPTALVYNGFDNDDYPEAPADAALDPARLTLLYTGSLYGGTRDPGALFEALRLMGADAARVRVIFHVDDIALIDRLAAERGVSQSVEARGPIPYAEVVEMQRRTDILLLLRWQDPRERGVVAGKLFEYIGARRPILSVGNEEGEAADIIRERGAGMVSNDAQAIAAQLRVWLAEKAADGRIAPIDLAARKGLSRGEQFAELERFLASLI